MKLLPKMILVVSSLDHQEKSVSSYLPLSLRWWLFCFSLSFFMKRVRRRQIIIFNYYATQERKESVWQDQRSMKSGTSKKHVKKTKKSFSLAVIWWRRWNEWLTLTKKSTRHYIIMLLQILASLSLTKWLTQGWQLFLCIDIPLMRFSRDKDILDDFSMKLETSFLSLTCTQPILIPFLSYLIKRLGLHEGLGWDLSCQEKLNMTRKLKKLWCCSGRCSVLFVVDGRPCFLICSRESRDHSSQKQRQSLTGLDQ